MFIADKLVFIELHKTGCTHIGKLLSQLLDGQQIGKHNEPAPDLFSNERMFLGSIRNPWEWYVSLWAYGCDKKGAVHHFVTNAKTLRGLGWRTAPLNAAYQVFNNLSRHPDRWNRSYANVDDPSGFRDWLYMMHDKKTRNDIREGYGCSSISQFAGLLTYRYMKLFCGLTESSDFERISSYSELEAFERRNCYIDHFIRNEHLEDDLITALELCGLNISQQEKSKILHSGKSNTSSRMHKAAYYYDNESAQFVREREKLIIEKFGYIQPTL